MFSPNNQIGNYVPLILDQLMALPLQMAGFRIAWQEAVEFYRADRCDLADTTVAAYTDIVNRLRNDHPDLSVIGRMNLVMWLKKHTEPATYNHQLFALKSFFSWCSEYYEIPDPSKGLKKMKDSNIQKSRVISEEEYQEIKAYSGYGRDIAVFLANTGLRAAEFLSMRPDHINGNILTVLGKGGKTRKLPLNQTALNLLSKYNPINLKKNGKYLTRTNLNYRMKHLSEKLNLPLFYCHCFRHYFATTLIKRGANIADVSKLLGHANINMTIKYYYHNDDLSSSVALLDSI